jgi:methylated-DNA-[protein]-cysteine S-methyltransferase
MQKSAARAVGTAMRTNPVCLIVPCHRVVCASGAAGNYAGGSINDVKVWLLNHERRHEA